ncbi:MAG: RNA polymerase sigma factor [Candidatus Limnocylindrales bacterium]
MDTELVIHAREGDQGAFADLADSFYARLHQVAFRILRDRPAAEDATQQAVLSMWRCLPQLRDPDRFEAWSYRLLVNACNSEFRRRKRMLPCVGSATHREPVAPDTFGQVFDRDLLEHGFAALSIDHRVVLVLRYYLDLPLESIAETLDVPIGTVDSRIHRALARMRKALEEPEAPPLPQGAVR